MDNKRSDTSIWSNYLLKFTFIVHLDLLYFNIFTPVFFKHTVTDIDTMLPDYSFRKAELQNETEVFFNASETCFVGVNEG